MYEIFDLDVVVDLRVKNASQDLRQKCAVPPRPSWRTCMPCLLSLGGCSAVSDASAVAESSGR